MNKILKNKFFRIPLDLSENILMNNKAGLILSLLFLLLMSCKKDETRTCLTCSSEQTLDFEVCEESNGNASVNGEDTGTSFEVYVSDLEEAGANCGG